MTGTAWLIFIAIAAVALYMRDRAIKPPKKRLRPEKAQMSSRDLAAIGESAQSLIRVINESLQIANSSKNPSTKVSRFQVALQRLQDLKELQSRFPVFQITALAQVEQNISDLAQEFMETGVYDAAAKQDRKKAARKPRK